MTQVGTIREAWCTDEECGAEWHGPRSLVSARRHARTTGHTTEAQAAHLFRYGPEVDQ